MEKERVKGKIVYIEPNEIYKEMGVKFGNGDNINWAPEDLSISIDLQVITSDRNNSNINGNYNDIYFNIIRSNSKNESKYISFLEGNKLRDDSNEGYLTDNYTDISYQEIRNNNVGDKETLGIQSIDISFDSHFFPIVKMKLIDVRGYSLMMPAEQNYADKLSKKAEACNNFFSSLFQFPYPRFALSVKGFYGDRVTFMLSVNDFQSSFNAQTGNFEVEIEFIGHMYGLYSDLPLNYILIAPYIGSESESTNSYWENKVNDGTFRFSDGSKIPTFVEFLKNYESMDKSFKELYEELENAKDNPIEKVILYRAKQKVLKDILDEYNSIVDKIGEKNTFLKYSNENYIFYFVKENTINLPSSEKLNTLIDDFNDSFSDTEKIILPESLNKVKWGIPKAVQSPVFNYAYGEYSLKKEHEYIKDVENTTLYNDIVNVPNYAKGYYTFLFKKEKNFVFELNRRISEYDDKVNSTLNESDNEIRSITKKILLFEPTIENIYRMIYAHIDTFMSSFYGLKKLIDNNRGKRNLKNLGLSVENTDVYSNNTNDFEIPAFTGFFKQDKNNNRVRRYPGEISELRELDEVYYVEKIYNSVTHIKSKIKSLNETNNNAIDTSSTEQKLDWTPLSIIDLYYSHNPYSFLNIDTSEGFVKKLFEFFIIRALGANIISPANSFIDRNGAILKEKLKGEVSNITKQFGKLLISNSGIKAELEEYSKNFDKLLECVSAITNSNENLKYSNNYSLQINDKLKFPIKNDGKIIPYSEFKGHKIVENSENNTCTYEEYNGINNKINVKLPFTTSKNFHSGIYVIDGPEYKKKDFINFSGKTTNLQSIRESNFEGYYFPLLQIGEKTPTNLFKKGFFKNEIDKNTEGRQKKAAEFLATLVGNKDLYKFEKDSASLYRLPKFLCLYFGVLMWQKENYILNEDYKFLVNRNGIYTRGIEGNSLKKLNEYSYEEFIEQDKNSGICNYFTEWADNEWIELYNEIHNIYTSNDSTIASADYLKTVTSITKNVYECFASEGKLSKILLNFYTETVDVIAFKESKNDKFDVKNLQSLSTLLLEYINGEENEGEIVSEEETRLEDTALLAKEGIYYTLKNLYDKWLLTYSKDKFLLRAPDIDKEIAKNKANGNLSDSDNNVTEFNSFVFIDTFYNDISETFLVNPKTLYELIIGQVNGENNRSCLQLMSDIAQKSKLLFICLPVFNNFYNGKSISNIFTPQNIYNGTGVNERGVGNTYVLMYTHEPSHNLNIVKGEGNTTEYSSDGFDIADTLGNITPAAIESFNKADFTIPAFGVTFAKQNQMYFKGLTLNMSNPRETDYSIYNRFLLASQGGNGATNKPSPIGQDMFSIYSNRVYDCGVEMMGCANIMPLMYFQLNNIPMYKGAYRIQNVKHHIENGVMTTSFVGTRISKNSIPFNTNVIDIESLVEKVNAGINEDNENDNISLGGIGITKEEINVEEVISEEKQKLINAGNEINVQLVSSDSVFNVYEALKYSEGGSEVKVNNKYPYSNFASTHECATFVKRIIREGFKGTSLNGVYYKGNAFECRNILPKMNFYVQDVVTDFSGIEKWNKIAEPGDIAVMKHGDFGHICIFHGDVWVSDYNQRITEKRKYGLWPYTAPPEIIYIFRYNGKRIMPKNYHKITINQSNVEIYDNDNNLLKDLSFTVLENININWKIKSKDKSISKVKVIVEDVQKKQNINGCWTIGDIYGYLHLDDTEKKEIAGDLNITIS